MANTLLGKATIIPRGAYSAETEYYRLNLVTDSGNSYLYIKPTPSTGVPLTNTSHWQQIASRGMTGPSAYDAAVAGGYMGTEAEFNAANAGIEAAKDSALGAAETANDAAENAETAAYRSMLWRKTPSGNPVSVYPVPESPLYPKVSGTFTQSGTGDPSPSNIRPITPWLASGGTVNIVQTDGATIALTAPQEIPAGWMDNEGKGQVTWGKKVFDGTEVWSFNPDGYYQLGAAVTANVSTRGSAKSNLAKYTLLENGTYHCFWIDSSGNGIRYRNPDILNDIAAFKAWLSVNNLVVYYPLATPVTLTLATAPLPALPQLDRVTPRQNVLTASTGSVELTYAKSPIREADELAAAIAALS